MMAVTGSIQTRNYTDKEGKNRKAFEVVADNVYFTESKNNNSGSGGYSPSPSYDVDSSSEKPSYSSGTPDEFTIISNDDDLPF